MQKNYNENLVAGAAIRDDKGRRISKLFEASHPKMTVGYAKNLIMPDTPTEQEFNFRQSGGGVIEDGVAVIDKVKGNSVVWNQRIKPNGINETTFTNGIKAYTEGDHIVVEVASGGATANRDVTIANYQYEPIGISGHVRAYGGAMTPTDNMQFVTGYVATPLNSVIGASTNAIYYMVRVLSGCPAGKYIFRPQVIDLTQMFGAGNEPSTYAEFLRRKPKVADEYAYSEGTIVNNKVEMVATTGRNLFDSSTAIDGKTIYDDNGAEANNSLGWCSTFIPIIGGESYFCKGVRIDVQAYGVHYYDKDKQHINGVDIPQNGRTFDAPINAKYIRIHGLYDSSPANAAILNLSDASINGQYFPHEKHELDLSWVKDIKDGEGVKLFEDGMKSAGTAFDEVAKGRAIKRIGVKVFDGNVAIHKGETSGDAYRVLFNAVITTSSNGVKNMLALNDDGVYAQYNGGYYYDKYAIGFASVTDIWFCLPLSVAQTISQVRAYLEEHPITFIYELSEPIEVEYDEKNLTYPVVAGGTEEAIASEPSTAFRADIGYGIDAVKTILDLKARVEALEGK